MLQKAETGQEQSGWGLDTRMLRMPVGSWALRGCRVQVPGPVLEGLTGVSAGIPTGRDGVLRLAPFKAGGNVIKGLLQQGGGAGMHEEQWQQGRGAGGSYWNLGRQGPSVRERPP